MRKSEKSNKLDELLYSCMPELERKILNAMPDEDEIDYQFSDEFENKMQVLIKREKLKRRYGIPVRTWKRIAAMFALILTGLLVATMSVDAIREKVYSYIKSVYDIYISTSYFSQEENTEDFVPLYPSYLPEGYELVIEDKGEEYLLLGYETEDGEGITLVQDQILDGMMVHTDNEFVKEETCEIQGITGTVGYKESGSIRIFWEKNQCLYAMSATNLTKEEMIKVIESMK